MALDWAGAEEKLWTVPFTGKKQLVNYSLSPSSLPHPKDNRCFELNNRWRTGRLCVPVLHTRLRRCGGGELAAGRYGQRRPAAAARPEHYFWRGKAAAAASPGVHRPTPAPARWGRESSSWSTTRQPPPCHCLMGTAGLPEEEWKEE